VSERTAALMAQWQAVGFCHGVMNTDNMSILGLTIDYGPFQFLDAFVPGHICNHSDPRAATPTTASPTWPTGTCLPGQALLPLIGERPASWPWRPLRRTRPSSPDFMARMRAKLGLDGERADDARSDRRHLAAAGRKRVDYTIFWRRLSHAVAQNHFEPVRDLFADRAGWDAWLLSYQ
jgi:uncharacterized protein YdiU (UPF0061 family)